MGTPILSVRDDQGNIIPIPAIQGRDGVDGKDGKDGKDGAAGPNLINQNTLTPMAGILMGSGGSVKTAVSGVDYMAPNAIALTPTTITFLDGNITKNAVLIKLGATTFLYYDGGVLAVTLANNHSVDNTTKFMYPPTGYKFVEGQVLPAFYMNDTGAIVSTRVLSALDTANSHFAISSYMDSNTTGCYYISAFLIRIEEATS